MTRTTLTTEDTRSRTLSKFEPEELLKLLEGFKPLVGANPAQAEEILSSNPDLTYAIVQSLLLMGLVTQNVIHTVTTSAAQPAKVASPPVASPKPRPADPAPSAAPAPAPAPVDKFAGMEPQQVEMIKQILNLTEEQINGFPVDQQAQIRELKQQYS